MLNRHDQPNTKSPLYSSTDRQNLERILASKDTCELHYRNWWNCCHVTVMSSMSTNIIRRKSVHFVIMIWTLRNLRIDTNTAQHANSSFIVTTMRPEICVSSADINLKTTSDLLHSADRCVQPMPMRLWGRKEHRSVQPMPTTWRMHRRPKSCQNRNRRLIS